MERGEIEVDYSRIYGVSMLYCKFNIYNLQPASKIDAKSNPKSSKSSSRDINDNIQQENEPTARTNDITDRSQDEA